MLFSEGLISCECNANQLHPQPVLFSDFHVSYRCGKILWDNLPDDIGALDEPLKANNFAEFVIADENTVHVFNTE